MAQSLRWTPEISEKRSRIMGAFSYMGILCFVPLVMGRDDAFVNFHARQGIVLWMWLVIAIFTLQVPGLGWFFSFSSSFITIMSLFGIISAIFLQMWKLPLVSYFADRL